MIHSFIGSIIWIIGLLLVGMFFGKITFIRENTLLAVTIIMLITAVIFPLILVGVNSIRTRIRGMKNGGKELNESNVK
jgi:membrane protein DedA with SNARE-associated domain